MWKKSNTTWNKKENLIDTERFERFLERLKTYSKCINSAGYSVINTLDDVYNKLKYQNSFFIQLTNLAEDLVEIDGIKFEKNEIYNLIEFFTNDEINGSNELRNYLDKDVAIIKAANSNLFKSDENLDFFVNYEPIIFNTTSGTSSTENIIWYNGTNGIYDGTSFQDILIESDFDNSWEDIYQITDIDNGYTQQNVFTSKKVFQKLLKNFHVIDVASTENIDITQSFVSLDIDSTRIVPQHRILLKDQIDKKENGIYYFENNRFIKDDILNDEEEMYYFSVFIKEGIINKNKEFFIDTNSNGTTPSINDEKIFVEGNNYVLRNRMSYRLLADHIFKSSDYFTENNPIIATNFTNNIIIENIGTSGTNSIKYQISDDFQSFDVYDNDNDILIDSIKSQNNSIFNSRLEYLNNTVYTLEINIPSSKSELKYYNGTAGLESVVVFSELIRDYDLISENELYYIVDDLSGTNFSLYHSEFSTSGLSYSEYIPTIGKDLLELQVLEDLGEYFIFYITNDEIYLNYNNENYLVKSENGSKRLRVELENNIIKLSWLNINDVPKSFKIDINHLRTNTTWTKDVDYQLDFFSKKEISDWQIINDDLYLKNVQITNLGTNFEALVPRIGSEDFRLYDGLDDYSDLPIKSFDSILNSGGNFSMEFKINPTNLRINQPVFYFGSISNLITYNFRLFRFRFQLPPNSYMTFYVNDVDDFPYLQLRHLGKILNIKSNKKLSINENTTVTFTYSYSTSKAVATLYFNGIPVGTLSDQRIESLEQTNIPLDIRTISYEKMYFGKSEFNTSPLYEGNLSEVRLWNTTLNPSQVLSRYNKPISTSDILYSNLKAYWKLNDFNAIHEEEIFNNRGIFYGGLNLDPVLPEIKSVHQIQLTNDYLYVLDRVDSEQFTSGFAGNINELDIFVDDLISDDKIVIDPTNSANSVVLLEYPVKQFGMNLIQEVRQGDIITGKIDTLYYASTSGIIPTGGLFIHNIQDSNGNLLRTAGTDGGTIQWFKETSTVPNSWNSLTFSYTVPSDLTYDGTNAVAFDDIFIQVLGWTDSNSVNTYYDNFYVDINRNIPRGNIYKFILSQEKVENVYSTLNGISSIYLENDDLYLLETQPNNIYLLNNTLIYENSGTNSIVEFAIVESNPYMLRESNILQDKYDNVIYISSFSDFETIYAKKQTDIDKFNLYWKQKDQTVNLLSDDYNNSTSGFILEHIASYPFIDNSQVNLSYTIVSGTNSTIVTDNITINDLKDKVLSNGVNLDENKLYWSINLKEVFGVYTRDSRLLIGIRTILNEIQVWIYDPKDKSYIRLVNNESNATFFISPSTVDMTYYVKDSEEYLSFIDPNTNTINWFKIEYDNKFSIEYLPLEFNYESLNKSKEIQYFNDSKYWILLENNEQLYLSQITNSNTNYNLWENDIEYVKNTIGWITGESGLVFVDNFTTPWKLEFNNIVLKDDFNDIEAIKDYILQDGYKTKKWIGTAYMVGKLGRIVRTFDNGSNFEVLNSGVYHDLNSVSFINERDGLIVGENNTILATYSSGDSFIPIMLPEEIGFRNWKKVLYYKEDNAIIIGSSGTIVHLKRNDQNWIVTKILNNLELTQLDIKIKEEDLDYRIDLNYIIQYDSDRYNGVIADIDYIGNDEFLICGENDLLCRLKLENEIDYNIPHLNFFRSPNTCDWKKIRSYVDKAKNEKRAFVLTCSGIYSFEYDRFVLDDKTNIKEILTEQIYQTTKEDQIRYIDFWNENYLISVGERVDVLRHTLFTTQEKSIVLNDIDQGTSSTSFIDVYTYDLSFEKQDLNEFFKPRLLFTDYYIGRKINIHLENGNFEKPTARFEKSLLDCFYFKENESLEFTDYGTVDKQNNFLAYQDFYYMNRRVLDGGLDKFAKMESEYHKYNKKIKAVNSDTYRTNYTWEANSCEGIFITDGTNGLVCKDNLLENSNFEKGSLFWENDTVIGDDNWIFTSSKARVIKTEPFLVSQSHILKQETILFKNVQHKFEYEVTNTGGIFEMFIYGYKLNGDKDILGSVSNPSIGFITFTPNIEYVAFGINVEYGGFINQTITLDNLILDKDDDAFRIFNEAATDSTTYTTGLFEESKVTKIQLDPATFIVAEHDVIDITVVESDKNKVIKNGDMLFLRIKNPAYDVYTTTTVVDGQADFGVLEVDSIDIINKTANSITIEIQENALEFVNLTLKERCIAPISVESSTSGDIFNVEVGRVIVNTTAIVKEYVAQTQTISLYELFNDAMVEEIKEGKLYLQNLNYFNGDLIHLEQTFNKHLLSDSFTLNVREKDYIIVDGYVNDLTKYYNLESNLILNLSSTTGTSGTSVVWNNYEYGIKYSDDVIYGPSYNLMTFLQNLNSTAFVASYEFDLPNHTFTYNTLIKNGLGEFKEFFINKSQIYVGEELLDIMDFKENTFLDITSNSSSTTLKKVHINSIKTETYSKYPNKKRYIIQTDLDLQNKLTLSGTITLRTRNRLDEISRDLEFTDDLMIPIPNQSTSGHSVDYYNRGYFKQVRTASTYSKLLMNDDNIRRHITGVVYLDEDNDWNLNVVDWKNDPNFYYRPIEIHEVGVDLILKKGVSIDSTNYLVKDNKLNLINVDFNKYNYKLVDLLSLSDLEERFSWILNAEIRNAVIGQDVDGNLVWYEGDWLCGIWENGIWYSGQAFNIEWVQGTVYAYEIKNNYNLIGVVEESNKNNTVWYNATWFNGTWNDGIWYNGIWNLGTRFNGDWFNGTWNDGIWESGNWLGGTWMNGTWLEGNFSEDNAISIWENGNWLGGDFESGIWKNGIWDQTDRLPSRFGTKASLLHKAIWEYGLWKNGQFHSGLTTDNLGNPIASTIYNNSIWKNGIWEKGNFYGGIWEMGRWNNGNWFNGLWQSNLQISKLEYKERVDGDVQTIMKVTFDKPHYFKNVNNISNYFIILGKPEIEQGVLHPNTELLGYNMNPIRHSIIEIVDDRTVLIEIPDGYFPYPESATERSSGTAGYEDIVVNFMTEIIETDFINAENILFVPQNNTLYVSHSVSGKIVTIDGNNNVSVVTGSTVDANKMFYNEFTEDLYVPNPMSNNLNIIDINSNNITNNIIVGNNPHSVVIKDLGIGSDVYISNSGSANLTIMDALTFTTSTISIGGIGSSPKGMALVGNDLFIACFGDNTVRVLDTTLNIVTNTINVGNNPSDMIYDSTNNRIHVINESDQSISIINATTKSVVSTLPMGSGINNIRFINDKIYVTTTNNVSVINNSTIETTFNYGINPYDIIYYPDFDMLIISNETNNKIYAVDANSYAFVEDLDTGLLPGNMVYNSINNSVYVVNRNSDNVTRIREFNQNVLDIQNCTNCNDYTLNIIEAVQFYDTPFEILQYVGEPKIASHWLNGTFNQGIWEFGWFNNGRWKGGIWLDGVFENGLFGSD